MSEIKIFRGVAKTVSLSFKEKDGKDPIDLTNATNLKVCIQEVTLDLTAVTGTPSGTTVIGDAVLGNAEALFSTVETDSFSTGRTQADGVAIFSDRDPIIFAFDAIIADLPC